MAAFDVVTLAQGPVRGILLESGVRRFGGIPYAQAPLGELRFRAPRPLAPDGSGHPQVTEPGYVALQNPPRLQGVSGAIVHPQSENCLQLTVWTPPGARTGQRLPVLVWLHGGAFLTGGGSLAWYDAAQLSAEGHVVVVSPNYRLGVLGFLCSPGVADGNMGLLDAQMAMCWVRENISAYGGDPDSVTVMGHSAGGWLAALLALRMPKRSPWMHRLVLLSAPLGTAPLTPAQAQEVGHCFRTELARTEGRDEMSPASQSLNVPSAALLTAQARTVQTMGPRLTPAGHVSMPLCPVADGTVLPEPQAYAGALLRAADRVPVLLGWTRDEMRAFAALQPTLPDIEAEQRAADAVFVQPTLAWADAARRGGRASFVFRFDWAPHGNALGACHGITSPFVFGNLDAYAGAPMLRGAAMEPMRNLSRRLRASLLAFVREGDPAAAVQGLRDWSPYRGTDEGVRMVDAADSEAME